MAIFFTSYTSVTCKNNTTNEGRGDLSVFSSPDGYYVTVQRVQHWLQHRVQRPLYTFDGNESLKAIDASRWQSRDFE